MRRRAGFTLIEVVLALSVLLIVGKVMLRGQRQLLVATHRPIPAIQWYLMLHELENPAHQFRVEKFSERGVKLRAGDDRWYVLLWEPAPNQRLILLPNGHNRGRIELMSHVASFSFNADQQLRITISSGEVFKARLLLGKVAPSP
ncbi:prepilin-type N-terminal cleavage/methylation domain-containing protein [Lactiplantibacillus sp. WILCCON 0030]|uniref:Prepilin-type N-terminal cleavage/methylation domain-containing protein n=1 Tax=Lactiplantibacillus brownii TaxID=3069269 RepID=A0ABU1A9R9_9LACO|nr:prepilin-type N-terminal cleavage/methylation domain-containing protein [Lactiplantibacillus brownii]MDQ7937674.1 prepilin-type N-terminal cleavage/methylation domain-containing protein [Lactiplantibacillus brownii]